MPDLAIGNGMVHVPEKLLRVMARIEDPMVLANQLLTGVLADRAELIVRIGDRALDVGKGNDGVLVQGKLLVGQVFNSTLKLRICPLHVWAPSRQQRPFDSLAVAKHRCAPACDLEEATKDPSTRSYGEAVGLDGGQT
jgi:hypothetical protein